MGARPRWKRASVTALQPQKYSTASRFCARLKVESCITHSNSRNVAGARNEWRIDLSPHKQ